MRLHAGALRHLLQHRFRDHRHARAARHAAALRAITTFYFEYDSSDLKPEAMRALDVHAKDLKGSGQHVVLEGHTDERGGREYNLALGQKRAEAVRRSLTLLGVSDSQLEAVSFGKEKPVALGTDEASLAQNRRGIADALRRGPYA